MEEKGMFKILDILYSYSSKNKILDETAIRDIVGIYLAEIGLNGLIRGIYFIDLSLSKANGYHDSKTYGYYDGETRIIFFDLNFIKNCVYRRHYANRFYINCVNLINQELIINIFHEMNHALRFSLKHDKFDIIDIISKNVWKIASINPDLYTRLHDYFPSEKEANVFAYEHCIWLFQYLNNYINDNYGVNNLYISFFKTIIDGYDMTSFINNPLKKVVLSSNGNDVLKYGKYLLMEKVIDLQNIDLYQRLTFGFPIKEDEYTFVKGLLDNITMCEYSDNLDIKKLILSKK